MRRGGGRSICAARALNAFDGNALKAILDAFQLFVNSMTDTSDRYDGRDGYHQGQDEVFAQGLAVLAEPWFF